MERRAKVELFEQIRREYEFGVGTIIGVAEKFGVHRRTVRQAITDAMPPQRKPPHRARPKLEPVKEFIDSILESDRRAPRKQRHTAHRIYIRIRQETTGTISEPSVRRYVRERKQAFGLGAGQVFIPQSYQWGHEAQVDWYEAFIDFHEDRHKVQLFSMRSMKSGASFHRAYPRATQQAFLEAHEEAFHYFGGVFRLLRYDNLPSAVKKILRGHTRQENTRFIAFRSHWRFEAEFCNPSQAHEKGGVEGEIGYFRRNHLVPIPQVANFADLNRHLLDGCYQDRERLIGARAQTVGSQLEVERPSLLPLAAERFEIAEVSFPMVDGKGCVKVRNNSYSTPLRARTKVRANILPAYVEVWHDGRMVARHERCYGSGQQILDLEHYLDVLARKPGAFANSVPLQQWREQGRWSESFDQLWESLQQRHGRQRGTKEMIDLLLLGRQYGYARLAQAISSALELGCTDAAAVRYLLTAAHLDHVHTEALALSALAQYERPLPVVSDYDQLLGMEVS